MNKIVGVLVTYNPEYVFFQSQVRALNEKLDHLVIIDNASLDYAAFCNVALVYYKLLDNVKDDNSAKSKLYSFFLENYLKYTYKKLSEENK